MRVAKGRQTNPEVGECKGRNSPDVNVAKKMEETIKCEKETCVDAPDVSRKKVLIRSETRM